MSSARPSRSFKVPLDGFCIVYNIMKHNNLTLISYYKTGKYENKLRDRFRMILFQAVFEKGLFENNDIRNRSRNLLWYLLVL